MANETLINTMSGRLNQESIKNNPDARLFLAEVATVIMHILLNDGKYNIIINQCLNYFKNCIFDFSISKIKLSQDFNYFRNKNDLELTNIFLEMLNLYFSYEEIREITLMFSGTKDVTKDYKIVFETYNNKNNATIDDDDNKALTITKFTDEDEIVRYFNKKVKSGYYKNIYKLLVDFTLMIYRRGSTSIDFSFPSFNKIITYINKNIYTYWVHSKPSEELERTFSYMWKKAKPLHINKAIEAFKIPYPIDKNGDFIIKEAKNSEVTFKEKTEKQNCEIEANQTTVADNSSNENTFIASQIDSVSIKRKMEQLFDYCERDIIDENNLLNNINYLIINKGWTNVYDLFGDISYIILTQKNIAKKTKEKISYHIFKPFEDKQTVFDKSFKKQLVIDTRQDARKSLRAIWYDNYSLNTLIKISKLFEPIERIDKLGELKINDKINYYQFSPLEIREELSVNDTLEPGNKSDVETIIGSISDSDKVSIRVTDEDSESATFTPVEKIKKMGSQEDILLFDFYKNAENFYQTEDKIIKMHKELASSYKWSNASFYIASISYVILRQLELANSGWGLNYKKLKNLYRKTVVLLTQFNISFSDENHYKNIDYLKEKFDYQYDMKLIIDFYRSIISIPQVNDDGVLLPEEIPTSTSIDSEPEVDIQKDDDKISEVIVDTPNDDDYEEDDSQVTTETDDVEFIEESEVDNEVEDSPVNITFFPQTRTERELAEFWYSTFPNGYYDTYIWKNKISTETYGELKEKLKICVNDKQKEKGFPKRFAKAIVVYCAEWYKREYNGNDGKGNPLDAIGIKQLRSLDLWEWADIDKKLLFGNEYLESIYTLGGFPIFYITSKKVDDILKELNSTYNDNTSNDSAKKRIFDKNKTLQYSLRKENGSLHLLFDYIKDPEHYPIADTDLDKDPFKKFIEGIQNFRKKWDKFSLDWIVECNEYAPLIRRKIRLKLNPEENGIHNNRIPYYRVEKFQEEKDIDIYLCFNDEDTEDLENREHIHFINTFNGYFVGESVIDYYIFSEIPTIDIDQIRVVAKHVDNEKSSNHDFVEIQVEQNIKPYLQLFETGKYSTYSTKRNQGDSYLLLPFNYPIVKGAINQDASPKYLTENGIKYRFTKIIDQLIITDLDGKVIPVYSQNNKIEVSIEKYSNIFVYQNENYFTRVVTDESGEETSSPVQLLFKKSDIKCTQYFDVTEPRDLEDDEVIIKFKKENDTFYSDWTENNQPEKGFIKLRVDVQDKKIHLDVYYIPSNEIPFKRDCIRNKIVIDNSVNIVESTSYDLKSYRDKYECLFKVGSTNDYVIIPIVKPLNITELYKDGEFIKEYKNESEQHIRIPLLFKDKYSIRRYDESGMAYHELANEDIDILDFKFEDDYSSIEKTIERSTPVGNIEFYLCTTKKYIETSEGYKLNVGEIGADNYIFYFWDMNLNHKPNRINGTYEDGLLNLHSKDYPNGIIFQSLEENVCPRHYYKPILTTYNKEWPKDSESLPTCLKCFDIASKHNIPYRVFKPLYWLLKDTDSRLIHFFACLILRHWDDENDKLLLSNLVRLSQELYFSWPFLNIKVWKNYKRAYEEYDLDLNGIDVDVFNQRLKNMAERLFVKSGNNLSPNNQLYLEQLTNIYWNNEKANGYAFQSRFDTDVWYTYNQTNGIEYDRGERLESCAIRFMRAKTIRKDSRINIKKKYNKKITIYDNFDDKKRAIVIIGFTDKENKRDRRDIKAICRFLRLLDDDEYSYLRIISYFKKNNIIKKTK